MDYMSNLDRHLTINAGWLAGPAFGVFMTGLGIYLGTRLFGWILAWSGAAVFICSILLALAASARAKGKRRHVIWPFLLMSSGVVLFCGGAAWYFLPPEVSGPDVASERVAPPPITQTKAVFEQERFAEINELKSFINKDEIGIRQEFDIPGMLGRNIAVQNIRISFRKSGNIDGFKYNNYSEGNGSFIFLAMEGKYHFTPSGPHVDEGPHDVLFLITTAKHQEAQKKLAKFLASTRLPDSINNPLLVLSKTIAANIETMTRTLNKRMNESDEYFTEYNNDKSRCYMVINNDYVSEFIPLKPKVDDVLRSITEYLSSP